MAVKIDKEALIKHRFWIMLGVAVPMILIALYVLRVDIASANEKKRSATNSALKTILNAPGPFPSQEEIDKITKEVEKANLEIGKVWGNVFQEQIPYMFWPDEFLKEHPFETGKFIREIKETTEKETTNPYHFIGTFISPPDNNYISVKSLKDGKVERFYRTGSFDQQFRNLVGGKTYDIFFQKARYFNDPLHDGEQPDYDKYYLSQIRPILDLVQPVNVDGVGVVQLRGWLAPKDQDVDEKDRQPPSAQEAATARYLRWVPRWNKAVDISEEAWMAQEDLWIQKEIYRNIRDANDQVAKMVGDKSEGFGNKATFANPYFEITLTLLSQSKLQVQLKNLRDNRQKLDIGFKIRMSKDPKQKWEKVDIQGEPLDPAGGKNSTLTKELTLEPGPPRTGIYEVEQVLTWETAAVRRIDQIAIGSTGVDDMSLNQRIFPEGTRPLVPPPVIERKDDDKFRPDMMPKAGLLTINGLVKDRYTEVNEQARRLPVGIALIVDQVHLGRILKSFENSKFRFVINQTLLNRYPGSLRPQIANKDEPARPAFGPGRGGEGRFGVRPGFQPPMPNGAGGEDTFESNVELVIYGTVTLYQRHPPRPPLAPAT